MSTLKATGLVLVNRIPLGEAPPNIKVGWIGLYLPCLPFLGFIPSREILSGTHVDRRYGVSVPQEAAMQILEEQRFHMAQYFRGLGYPRPGEYFNFGENEVQIISGVVDDQPGRVRQMPEEAWGQLTR